MPFHQTLLSLSYLSCVDADLGAITKAGIRPFSKVRKGYTAFTDGDVIMAKITPCMENGKAAVARDLENGLGFGSTEFHVIRSNGAVLPDYVYYFIRQQSFRKSAESEMTGSVGQKRVPVEFLQNTEIPLPPLSEQKRLVDKLQSLVNVTRNTRDRLERIPTRLKYFRQAILAAACSGSLTEDWRKKHPGVQGASVLLARIKKQRQLESKRVQEAGGTNRDQGENDEDGRDAVPQTWQWCSVGQIATVCLGGTPSRKQPAYGEAKFLG